MPVRHVIGQPAASTYVREKGCVTCDTNRDTPCSIIQSYITEISTFRHFTYQVLEMCSKMGWKWGQVVPEIWPICVGNGANCAGIVAKMGCKLGKLCWKCGLSGLEMGANCAGNVAHLCW